MNFKPKFYLPAPLPNINNNNNNNNNNNDNNNNNRCYIRSKLKTCGSRAQYIKQ